MYFAAYAILAIGLLAGIWGAIDAMRQIGKGRE